MTDPTPPGPHGPGDTHERSTMMDRCDCGHERSAHRNGLWDCKRCSCREWQEPVVPDLFDDLPNNPPLDPAPAEDTRS